MHFERTSKRASFEVSQRVGAVRAALMVALALLTTGAVAAWEEVGGNDRMTIYADKSTRRKVGSVVKMWYLLDYKEPQKPNSGGIFLSSKDQSEYDCKGERSRTLYFTNHLGNMGDGGVIYTSEGGPMHWVPVAPGSLSEQVWQVACGSE